MEDNNTETDASAQPREETSPPEWTYPTRFCRICREDVPPTVTMYPPGLPMQFQKPIVEYKNEDEYGRLIKPCKCRGSLRYIHELCLLRSRTEVNRRDSAWKCHECGHRFNFKRLTVQRYLSSKITIATLTILFMITVVFILGFIADPIINFYLDPYDSLVGNESIWDELEIRSAEERPVSAWAQHFTKGFISMGLVGFMKTLFLNPFHWLNVRMGGSWTTTRATTGRDRAVNLSWIAIVIGISSAFVFFYRWMQAFVQRSLQRIGNNIVDTQLPGDDDDLKPPPGWKYPAAPGAEQNTSDQESANQTDKTKNASHKGHESSTTANENNNKPAENGPETGTIPTEVAAPATADARIDTAGQTERSHGSQPLMSGSWIEVDPTQSDGHDLSSIHRQGWSFSNI